MESWAELDCAEAVGGVAKDNTAAASMLKITPDVSLTFIAADDPIRFGAARLHLSPAQRNFTCFSARLLSSYTVLWANALPSFVTHIVGETRLSSKGTKVTKSRGR